MKKYRAVMAAFIAVVMLLTACGSKDNNSKSSKKKSKKTTKTEETLSDDDLEQINSVNDTLEQVRSKSDFASADKDKQMDIMFDSINQLADDKLIDADSIYRDDENFYITFEYSCGALGGEILGEEDPDTCSFSSMAQSNVYSDDLQDEFFNSSEHRASILILDSLIDQTDVADGLLLQSLRIAAGNWKEKGIDTKLDLTVTLDDFLDLEEYSLVAFFIHGNCLNYKNKGKIPMMRINQRENSDTNHKFESDISGDNAGNLPIIGGRYCITPGFIQEHYKSGATSLDGCIFFLGSCLQMGENGEYNEGWTEICSKTGVPSLVAFHNEVGKGYASSLLDVFVSQLLSGETAKQAFDLSLERWGTDERGWYIKHEAEDQLKRTPSIPCFRGNESAKFKWLSMPTPTPIPTPTPVDQFTWSRDGNHVTFGRYEQDGDLTNGKEPIEWEILSEEDGKMLLISLSILDSQPYDEDWSDDATWETCSLRTWLNNDFFNEAFSEVESDMILTTTLQNPNNPIGGLGGNDTEDKVFILSVNEALSYYDQEDLYEYENQTYSPWFVREVTPYAISRGIWHNVITEDHYLNSDMYKFYTYDVVGMDSGSWWLRSPGNFNNTACLVFGDGSLGWGNFENSDDPSRGVRPVIWVDLNNMPVQADANVAAPIPDEVRDAYLDKANSVSNEEFVEEGYDQPGTGDFTFDLVYINDDDIPELLICQNERNEYRGDRIRANVYTYKDGRVVEVIHTVLGECIDVGAYTYYYPRENLVRESYRISSSEQGVVVYRMSSDGEEAKETSYVVEYKERESEDAPMEVTYSIYDRSDWSLIGEVSEEEFKADTQGTGEEVPLVASNTLEQFIEKLQ